MEYHDEDVKLMLHFQEGDESCFVQLVERYKERIFKFAYRFLGNYQDAEDVAQETFIKAYRAKDRYVPKSKLSTWLYVICKNTCLKRLRKKEPPKISIDENVESEENAVKRQIPDLGSPNAGISLLNKERADIIKEAVDALPTNQRMVVILYRYEQLSYKEISKITRLSTQAIKSLLHRAKENLKIRLAEFFRQ
ncbi:RNA polymerase sigma factor [Candidatus Omnitrophota bacterium]